MLAMCLLTAFSDTTSSAAAAALDRPPAMSARTSRSRRGEPAERFVPGPSGEEPGHDVGVHDCAAGRHPAHGVDELAHVRVLGTLGYGCRLLLSGRPVLVVCLRAR
jgi:hypothetical protein